MEVDGRGQTIWDTFAHTFGTHALSSCSNTCCCCFFFFVPIGSGSIHGRRVRYRSKIFFPHTLAAHAPLDMDFGTSGSQKLARRKRRTSTLALLFKSSPFLRSRLTPAFTVKFHTHKKSFFASVGCSAAFTMATRLGNNGSCTRRHHRGSQDPFHFRRVRAR